MKLLIVTQVVDTKHPILGFFHRWIEEFAKHCEEVHVICLQEGTHNLPANVTVYSLGKEEGKGRLTYLYRFYKLIWQLRHDYDGVFVHMNQVYVILGAVIWRTLGKKIGLWYTHGTVSKSLQIAEKNTNYIFSASADSFKLKSDKVIATGHGINVNRFKPKKIDKDLDLITVGRITDSKNLFVLIDLVKGLQDYNQVSLVLVGAGVTQTEKDYEKSLRQYVSENELDHRVQFVGKIVQEDLPTLLNRAKVFVTVAKNGSLDKVMLEAMSCGLSVISMASGSVSLPLGGNQVLIKEDFVKQVTIVLELGKFVDMNNVEYIQKNHSIKKLIPKILHTYTK